MGETLINIILIDDNEALRESYAKYLRQNKNYNIKTFESGENAIEFIKSSKESIDFCLIDQILQTRHWNGFRSTREILKVDPKIVVIIFTNKDDIQDKDREKAFKAGAIRYEVKGDHKDVYKLVFNFSREISLIKQIYTEPRDSYQDRAVFDSTLEAFNGLGNIAEEIKKKCNANYVHIRYLDNNKLTISSGIVGYIPVSLQQLSCAHLHHPDALAYQRRVPVYFQNTYNEPDYKALSKHFPEVKKGHWYHTRSWVSWPVRIKNNILAVFNIQSETPDKFQESDLELKATLINCEQDVASAMKDFLSYKKTLSKLENARKQKNKLETLVDLIGNETIQLAFPDYLNKICNVIKHVFAADICTLYLWNPVWGRLKLEASTCDTSCIDYDELYYSKSKTTIFQSFLNHSRAEYSWEPAANTSSQLFKFQCLYHKNLGRLPKSVKLFPIIDDLKNKKQNDKDKEYPHGIIEIINADSDDAYSYENEQSFMHDMQPQINTTIQNRLMQEKDRLINKMMATLSHLFCYIPQAKTLEEISFLFLLAITHNEGLKHNRAFLIIPDLKSGKLEIKFQIGPKNKQEATEKWPHVPAFQDILDEFIENGIPETAFCEKDLIPQFIPNWREALLFKTVLSGNSTIRIWGHLQEKGDNNEHINTRLSKGEINFLNDLVKNDNNKLNEIAIIRLDFSEKEKGFLMVDNIYTDRHIDKTDRYLLEQYAYVLTATIQRWMATERFKRLTSELAHEIRNSVQSIISYDDLLHFEMDKEVINLCKEQIECQSEFIRVTLNSLIETVKMEHADWKIKTTMISIRDLFEIVRLSINPELENNNIKLDIQQHTEFFFNGDLLKLQIVLVNLIRNSIYAYDRIITRERRKIILKGWQESEKIIIIVKDFGPGMNEQDPDSLFEPFQGTRTGLGLSIVKRIIEKHGGTVSINTPGIGIEFLINLP